MQDPRCEGCEGRPAERFALARKRYGEDGARAIWDFSHHCAEAVRAFAAEHRIDCELRSAGGWFGHPPARFTIAQSNVRGTPWPP